MIIFLAFVFSYFIGAIPFALLVGKLVAGVDIRQQGSGNLGTTNTMRVLGFKLGLLVLLGDMGKGALCAYLGHLAGGPSLAMLTGIVAVLGHIFPVYVGFKGGKGIATGGGVFLFVMPVVFFLGIGVFLLVLLTTSYVSLASLSASLTIGILASLAGYRGLVLAVTWAVVVLVFISHRPNIGRLLSGQENKAKIWGRKKKDD